MTAHARRVDPAPDARCVPARPHARARRHVHDHAAPRAVRRPGENPYEVNLEERRKLIPGRVKTSTFPRYFCTSSYMPTARRARDQGRRGAPLGGRPTRGRNQPSQGTQGYRHSTALRFSAQTSVPRTRPRDQVSSTSTDGGENPYGVNPEGQRRLRFGRVETSTSPRYFCTSSCYRAGLLMATQAA